ncbi:MAG: pilus assembly protein PilZ, partial [Novosphingobium sp. 12-63-9]
MSNVDTRQMSRDSLFVMARCKVEGDASGTEHRVKVRNLSAAGMMAEGDVKVSRGSLVSVDLR